MTIWSEIHQKRYDSLVDRLDRAIPPDELKKLLKIELTAQQMHGRSAVINGGTIRGFHNAGERVASYNNTRKDEAEIIAWFERALALT